MFCTNCQTEQKSAWHDNGCVTGALFAVLNDRGFDLAGVELTDEQADRFWSEIGGPAADSLAELIGWPPYPEN